MMKNQNMIEKILGLSPSEKPREMAKKLVELYEASRKKLALCEEMLAQLLEHGDADVRKIVRDCLAEHRDEISQESALELIQFEVLNDPVERIQQGKRRSGL